MFKLNNINEGKISLKPLQENKNKATDIDFTNNLLNPEFKEKRNIWTIQMSKWRSLPDDIKIISIVSKENHCFSPIWSIVEGHKSGDLNDEGYKKIYLDKLNNNIVKVINALNQDLSNGDIAYTCYCNKDKFCHRHLLIEFIKNCLKNETFLKQLKYDIEIKGEFNN